LLVTAANPTIKRPATRRPAAVVTNPPEKVIPGKYTPPGEKKAE
jgi:hypothetical protein